MISLAGEENIELSTEAAASVGVGWGSERVKGGWEAEAEREARGEGGVEMVQSLSGGGGLGQA